jgi:hypothetical protein
MARLFNAHGILDGSHDFRNSFLAGTSPGEGAYEYIRPETKRLGNHNAGANKFRSVQVK